jgi:hypothetical protein
MTTRRDQLPALGVRQQPQSPAHIGADRTERETIRHRVRMFLDGGYTYLEALRRAYCEPER